MVWKSDFAQSPLCCIMKNKVFILSTELKSTYEANKRIYIKACPHQDLQNVLMEWYEGMHSENLPIKRAIIWQKVNKITLTIGTDNFKATNGWLDRFIKRWHTKIYTGRAEVLIRCSWILEDWIIADEFGTLQAFFLYRHGVKNNKGRSTAPMCANLDTSEKLPPLVVGKYTKPSRFKNVWIMPCKYSHNGNTCITYELCKNVPKVTCYKNGWCQKEHSTVHR